MGYDLSLTQAPIQPIRRLLGVIGGFNVLGSLFFGWAGGRWNKLVLLGLIYTLRSLTLAWYFMAAPTPESTMVFASIMSSETLTESFSRMVMARNTTAGMAITPNIQRQAMSSCFRRYSITAVSSACILPSWA